GWLFDGRTGALSGSTTPASAVLDDDRAVQTRFVEAPRQENTLTESTNGSGTVASAPPAGAYAARTEVVLMAIHASKRDFANWDGALSGSSTPASLVIDQAQSVVAVFQAIPPAPAISGVVVEPGTDKATVSWQTDQPTTGIVEYGTSTTYEL